MEIIFKIGYFFKKNWIRFLVSIVLSVGIMFLYVGTKNEWAFKQSFGNAICVSGLLVFGFGLLVFVQNFGTFDMFSYYPGRKKKEDGHKETYAEYSKRKNSKRKLSNLIFLPYLIVGAIDIILSVFLTYL